MDEKIDHLREFFNHDHPLGRLQAVSGFNGREVFRKYFHEENRPYGQILSQPTMIVGRKGAGKTDLLLSHKYSQRQGRNFDPLVYFDDKRAADTFRTILVKINRQVNYDEPKPMVEQVAALWAYLLWLTIFRKIGLEGADSNPDVMKLRDFTESHGVLEQSIGPYETILRGLISLITAYDKLPEAEQLFGFFQGFERIELSEVSYPEALAAADSYLTSSGKKGIILFDSFEQLDVTQEETRLTLSGLLRSLSQFTSPYRQVEVRCCIPAEAFFRLTEISSNVLKDFQRHTVLHWTATEILQLCAKRFAAFLEIEYGRTLRSITGNDFSLETPDGTQAFWSIFLPKLVPNTHPDIFEGTLTYLLRHTQLLPRQMIALLNQCFNQHFKDGLTIDDKLRPQSISESVRYTEARLYEEIFVAHNYTWPASRQQIESVFPSMKSNVFGYGDLHRAFNKSGAKGFGNVHDFDDYLRMLTEVGAIGRLIKRTNRFIVAQFEYSEPARLLFNDTDELCIHPCFTRTTHVMGANPSPENYMPVYPLGAQLNDPDRRNI